MLGHALANAVNGYPAELDLDWDDMNMSFQRVPYWLELFALIEMFLILGMLSGVRNSRKKQRFGSTLSRKRVVRFSSLVSVSNLENTVEILRDFKLEHLTRPLISDPMTKSFSSF